MGEGREGFMIIDTHAHYDDRSFDADRDEIISSLPGAGIGCVINAGSDAESIPRVMALAHRYDFIYASVGIHPDELGGITPKLWGEMQKDMEDPKVAAAGEIGLDYYGEGKNDPHVRELQKEWFRKQIEMGLHFQKPILVHSRDAAEDTLNIIREYYGGGKIERPGIIHCFAYSPEMAEIYAGMGFKIGIGGVVTFKNSKKLKETAAKLPLGALVLETDCPYLSPEPHRGERNSSLNLPYVAEAIAAIRGIGAEEVIRETEKNARELFKIS